MQTRLRVEDLAERRPEFGYSVNQGCILGPWVAHFLDAECCILGPGLPIFSKLSTKIVKVFVPSATPLQECLEETEGDIEAHLVVTYQHYGKLIYRRARDGKLGLGREDRRVRTIAIA